MEQMTSLPVESQDWLRERYRASKGAAAKTAITYAAGLNRFEAPRVVTLRPSPARSSSRSAVADLLLRLQKESERRLRAR